MSTNAKKFFISAFLGVLGCILTVFESVRNLGLFFMFGSASLIYAWDHGLLPFTESTSELDEPDNVEGGCKIRY